MKRESHLIQILTDAACGKLPLNSHLYFGGVLCPKQGTSIYFEPLFGDFKAVLVRGGILGAFIYHPICYLTYFSVNVKIFRL